MTTIQFIMTVVIVVTITMTPIFLYRRKRIRDSFIELNCRFCLSDSTDELLDTYKKETGVHVDGILGNDFMVRHGYHIDYENMVVKHKSVKISIKDSMDIVEIPLIVLYQGWNKYIFMLDTGAMDSVIHSKYEKNGLDIDGTEDNDMEICGVGGSGMSSKTIKARLYYSRKRNEDRR